MTWAHRASVTAHRCRPPVRDRTAVLAGADGGLGDVWRCDDCRKLWRVGRACAVCDLYGEHAGGGSHAVGLTWRPATLWQRLRYRRSVSSRDQTSGIRRADTEGATQ